MQKKPVLTAVLAIGILALAFALVLSFMPQGAKPALAAEVAQKSYQAVSELTVDQQGALVQKLQVGNPVDLLQRAKEAKDLKVLTYEQFISQNPIPPDGNSPDLHNLTFLQFTDTDGSTVTLGVNPSTNLPELVTVAVGIQNGSPNPESGSQGGSVQSSQGSDKGFNIQFEDKNVKVQGTISPDGTGTFTVNGKKYTAPVGTKFSPDAPMSVKIEGGDVYVNGMKLTPVQ